jgi:DNA-directed RNA polymerase specialized sigma24 family protein
MTDMSTTPGMAAVDISPYEGLIFTTAKKFAGMAGMEEEDMRQELRLKVAQSLVAYSKKRSNLSVKNFVFGCMTNRVTDLRKAHCRKLNYGIGIRHIEDFKDHNARGVREKIGGQESTHNETNRFDFRYFHVDHEEIYGKIDEGLFVLPATLNDLDRSVLLLLTLDMTRTEIAMRLGITRAEAFKCVEGLKEKFRDWEPGSQPNDSSTVKLTDIPIAA